MTSIDRAGNRFSELLPGSSAPRWKTPIVSIKNETFDFNQRIED